MYQIRYWYSIINQSMQHLQVRKKERYLYTYQRNKLKTNHVAILGFNWKTVPFNKTTYWLNRKFEK